MRLALILITTICLGASCKTAKNVDSSKGNGNTTQSLGTVQIDGQNVQLQTTTSQRPEEPAKKDAKGYDNQYKEHSELNRQ